MRSHTHVWLYKHSNTHICVPFDLLPRDESIESHEDNPHLYTLLKHLDVIEGGPPLGIPLHESEEEAYLYQWLPF